MAESSSRNLVGLFLKKSNKQKEDNPAVAEKKKHKRQYSVRLTLGRRQDKCCESQIDRSHLRGKSINGTRKSSVEVNEKDKPKNLRRRLPFGRPESLEQKELNSTEDTCEVVSLEKPALIQPVETNEPSKWNEHQGEGEIEKRKVEDEGKEKSSHSNLPEAPTEGKCQEPLPVMASETLPQDFLPDVASELHKRADNSTPGTCPDKTPAIDPNCEGQSDFQEDKLSPLKELMFNEQQVNHVDSVSSISQCEVCLHAYGNLIGAWSFVIGLARDAAKQVLLYFISSLIKQYPQCFKGKVKKRKRRNQKANKRVMFNEIIQVQ